MPALSGEKRKGRSYSRPKRQRVAVRKPSFKRTAIRHKHHELTAFERIQRDPFGTNTGPAYLPDQFSTAPRQPLMLEANFRPVIRDLTGGLTSGTDVGNATCFIGPHLDTGFYTESGTTLTSTDHGLSAAAAHPEYTTYSNLNETTSRLRILSLAVKVMYTGAADARAGEIGVLFTNRLAAGLPLTWMNWENANPMSGSFSMQHDLVCTSHLFAAPDFHTLASNDTTNYINGIGLSFAGVPADSIKIQTRMWVEVIPNPDSVYANIVRSPTFKPSQSYIPTKTTTAKSDK